jgi:predicted Zn-dependent protease
MRRPLTLDDVEDLGDLSGTPEQLRARAAQLVEWAAEIHPDDEDITPAALLVSAGERLATAGDDDAALDLFRRAVAAEGHVPPDVRCYLHRGLLEIGDVDAARRVAEELRRERPPSGDVYVFIGENYELAGDLREAHRWMTMGLLRMADQLERGDEGASVAASTLAGGRYRVRRALDLPMDEYDEVVEATRFDG